jgi:hypothetical protein
MRDKIPDLPISTAESATCKSPISLTYTNEILPPNNNRERGSKLAWNYTRDACKAARYALL